VWYISLCLCFAWAVFRFHLLQRKRKHKLKRKKKETFWSLRLYLRLYLFLRQGCFHSEMRIIALALVLASLVKTWLSRESHHPIKTSWLYCHIYIRQHLLHYNWIKIKLNFKIWGWIAGIEGAFWSKIEKKKLTLLINLLFIFVSTKAIFHIFTQGFSSSCFVSVIILHLAG